MKQKKHPLVSVILRFFNDEKYIRECIESVLNQDYKNIELILVNNDSQDNSAKIADEFLGDKRVKILRNDKNVISGAFSTKKGLKESEGEYITLFCADDVMNKNCISKKVEFLEENPEFLACFANLEIIDQNSKKTGGNLLCAQKNNRFEYLRYIFQNYFCVTFPGATIRKKDFLYDAMDERLVHFFDVALWVNILQRGEIKVLDEYHVKYRQHGSNVSAIFGDRNKYTQYLFELDFFYDEFFKIKDFELIYNVFPEAKPLLNKIDKEKDTDLLGIIIAITLFNNEKYTPFISGILKNIALRKITRLIDDKIVFKKATDKIIDQNYIVDYSKYYNEGIEIDCRSPKKNNLFTRLFLSSKLRKKRRSLENNHQQFQTK